MRRFEYKDQKSDKFWEIEQTGPELTTRWGRIGTGGQSKTKDFGNELSAKLALTKQIDEKLGKGYQEVAASGQPLKPAPSSADAAAPWLRGQPAYILPAKSFPGSYHKEFVTLPSRRNPIKSDLTEAALPLSECFNQFKLVHSFYAEKSDAPLQEVVREAASFVENYHEGLAISEDAAAIIVSALIADWSYSSSDAHLYKIKSNILVHLRDKLGWPDFIRTFCAAESLQVNAVHLYPGRGLVFSDIVGASNHGSYGGFLSGREQTVRALLAQAEEEQWLACEKIILDNIDSLDPMRRPRVALVIPDSREISDHAARTLLALPQIPYTIRALIFTVTDPQLAEAVEKAEPDYPSYFYQNEAGYLVDEQLCNTLLAERGAKALDLLLPKAEVPHISYLVAHINDPRAIEALALLIQKGGKKSIANTQLAVKNWAKAALVALGGLLTKSRREASFLLPTFITLCQDHPEELAEISAWFDETTRKVVQELLNSGANVARADLDGLPEVLVNPPWTQKRVKKKSKPLNWSRCRWSRLWIGASRIKSAAWRSCLPRTLVRTSN